MRWFSFVVCSFSTFLFASGPAFGQSFSSNGLYCTAGLIPDGYIDFTQLPVAPTGAPGQPSAPVTATLPVHGVPGLMVTVTIPALTAQNAGPIYSVSGGTLQLNALPVQGVSEPPTVLSLAFNQSIYGIGLNTETSGRFDYSYTLQVGTPTPAPSPFSTTAAGYTLDSESPQAQSLQMVGLQTPFQTASVQFSGAEFYRIALSNIRVRSASAPDSSKAVPTKGLEQWLRADTGSILGGVWKDQSGHGHDAYPGTTAPAFTADGRNCQAAWLFSNDAYFSFNLPIAGWGEMTVFLVAKATTDGPPANLYSQNSAILWTENEYGGNTFVSPYQTHVSARFGTTRTGNNLFYARPGGGVGQDFTSTRAVHDHETDTLYVNGLRVLRQDGKLPVLGGVTGAGTIGEGIHQTFFNGEISEILVYNRVLCEEEAASVENYLAQKYGLH
jgi:hypothetical protein